MIIFREHTDGQLEVLDSIREIQKGSSYVISELIIGNTFVESRIHKHRTVNTICNRDGSPAKAHRTNTNYRDMIPEQMSHVKIRIGHHLIFVRRFTDDKQDPYIFICEVNGIYPNGNDKDVRVTVLKIQRYQQKYVNKFGIHNDAVRFAVEEQLDHNYIPPHYSYNQGVISEDCVFVRKGNTMHSYTKDGKELVLDDRSMIQRRYKGLGYLPSSILMKIAYDRFRVYPGSIQCDGYQYEWVPKDTWMDVWKDILDQFGSLDTLCYVSTINGDTILAFVEDDTIKPLIKTNKGFETVELSAKQRPLIQKISQAYFGSIGSVFV